MSWSRLGDMYLYNLSIHHVVFVANITNDVLLGLDLMEPHKLQLDFENIEIDEDRTRQDGYDNTRTKFAKKRGHTARVCQHTSNIRNHC